MDGIYALWPTLTGGGLKLPDFTPDPNDFDSDDTHLIDLELRHLRGAASRFEVSTEELKRLIEDVEVIQNELERLSKTRTVSQRLVEKFVPILRTSRELQLSTLNVLRMNLQEIARTLDSHRSADERQLVDIVDSLVERLARIDVHESRLNALEQRTRKLSG